MLGVSGGEGRMNLGSASSILEWGTSIDYSLNDLGYCAGGNCAILGTNLVVNSPATDAFYTPNPTYPDWIYDVIYEVKISRGAFTGGFGRLEVPYIHASPSKLGTNTIYALPGPCPGEIGDFVWHDIDLDGIQDPGEPGIDNVRLNLYKDNGDGIFNTATDSLVGFQITTAGGKYLFQNLAAADYWVQVVESTVPAGYTTTTYNTPMLVNLSEGESYLEADFGYATPSTLDYGDAPDTGAGAAQGNYNTTSTDNGPRHTIVSTLKLGNVARHRTATLASCRTSMPRPTTSSTQTTRMASRCCLQILLDNALGSGDGQGGQHERKRCDSGLLDRLQPQRRLRRTLSSAPPSPCRPAPLAPPTTP